VAAITAFNATISLHASNHDLALVDMNSFYKTLQATILFNNVNYSSVYLHGGAFSTDGYHPTQRGCALMANEIVSTINRFYSAKIPLADVNAYPGIIFP
jgi:lysophospholipase L1-like esterase